MSVYSGTLTSRSVHPASPVLLTKNGPLGTLHSRRASVKNADEWPKPNVQHIIHSASTPLTDSEFEGRKRTLHPQNHQSLALPDETARHDGEERRNLKSLRNLKTQIHASLQLRAPVLCLLSWGKLQVEPATRWFDWSFAPIPRFDDRFARQNRYEPPSGFPLTSLYPGIVHHLSGPIKCALSRCVWPRPGTRTIRHVPVNTCVVFAFAVRFGLQQPLHSHT